MAANLPASALRKLGVFVAEHFLTPAECAHYRHLIRTSPQALAPVGAAAGPSRLKLESRRSSRAHVSVEDTAALVSKVNALRNELQAFFESDLGLFCDATFLQYREGDFFRPHRDRKSEGILAHRRVGITVALNARSDEPGPEEYRGDGLVLYGLINKPEWSGIGFRAGSEGTLIAFRADVLHEAAIVEAGNRFSFIGFFMDPTFQPSELHASSY